MRLRKDVETLKEGHRRLQEELQEIKNLLRTRSATIPMSQRPQNVLLNLDVGFIKGDIEARLVLFDFTDYQCPYSGRHVRETLPKHENEYIKTGKLRYVVREFPIESIHPHAFRAAEAALCAEEQGMYWEMHHRLFINRTVMEASDLSAHALVLGIDLQEFQQCLSSGKKAARIRNDISGGQRAGVTGTPTFFLGIVEGDGPSAKVYRTLKGIQRFETFKEAIDSVVSMQK